MSEFKDIEKCKRCNKSLSGDFCSSCGYSNNIKKINYQFILSEIGSVINFEKGILFTIKELLIRPGVNIRKFIREDRNRLVKPISFIIFCSLVYIIAQRTIGFQDGYINFSDFDWEDSSIAHIIDWISSNYGFTNIIMAIFIALWIKLFFRRYDYNYFEILILLYFILGIQMLLFSVFGVLESITNLKVLDIGSSFAILYVVWAISRFFDKRKKTNYLKGLISYFLGMISFLIVAILIGVLIDLVIK